MVMKKFTFLVLVAILSTGCATMFNSDNQTLIARPSNVDHKGAKVEVTTSDGSYSSELPATIVSSSSYADVSIRVVDECYSQTQAMVGKSITPSFWANILFWPGFIVDAATGKFWRYDSSVVVQTEKVSDC